MNRLILLLLMTLLSGSLFAQRPERLRNDLYIGVSGGAHLSTVDFVPRILQTQRFGVQSGVAAKFVSNQLTESGSVLAGVIAELNFSQRGWTEDFDQERHPGFAYSRALNYIDLPIMTHLNAGTGNVRFIFNVGPQISFLLSDASSMSQALADHLVEHPISPRFGMQYLPFEYMRRIDYGIIGGMGVQLRTPIGHFDLEGRYFVGLGDVFESRRSRNAHFSRSAHRVMQVRLTYYMRIN